jgi:hypothetical protein
MIDLRNLQMETTVTVMPDAAFASARMIER